jgi:hypothetical protein
MKFVASSDRFAIDEYLGDGVSSAGAHGHLLAQFRIRETSVSSKITPFRASNFLAARQ